MHFSKLNSITKVIGGGGHSFIILESGQVYGCGSNKNGQLALDEQVQNATKFQLIVSLGEHLIRDIACGWNSTIALTENNIALVWGSNSHLQLGLSNKSNYYKPHVLDYSVRSISMGLRHMAILYENGSLATAGSNSKGQLCLFDEFKNPVKQSKLVFVPDMHNIVKVACGQNHTITLTANGELYGFGDNRFHQICANSPDSIIYVPKRILICDYLPIDSKILCGWTHNAISTADGNAILWGRNNYGQLTGTSSGPVVINNVYSLALGSEHCLCIDNDRILYTWGWNEHCNCGIENCDVVIEKTFLANDCLKIGTGFGYSFAVLSCCN